MKKFLLLLLVGLIGSAAVALSDPEAKLSSVLRDYITTRDPSLAGQDIRISFKYADKLMESLKEVDEKAEFKVAEVFRDFKPVGNVIFPVVVNDRGRTTKIFARTNVAVYQDVVIAGKRFKRGEAVDPNDTKLESRDVALLPKGYFNSANDIGRSEAKTSIPEGSTIFAWMLKEVPAVRRGEAVNIRIIGDNLTVSCRGKILEDGCLNQKVKARRDGAALTDMVEGILINSNEVEVRL